MNKEHAYELLCGSKSTAPLFRLKHIFLNNSSTFRCKRLFVYAYRIGFITVDVLASTAGMATIIGVRFELSPNKPTHDMILYGNHVIQNTPITITAARAVFNSFFSNFRLFRIRRSTTSSKSLLFRFRKYVCS